MKTTIDIADDLLMKSKRLAQKEDITLRQLVEEGLSFAVKRRRTKRKSGFKLVTFGEGGLTPEFKSMSWRKFRELANERPASYP